MNILVNLQSVTSGIAVVTLKGEMRQWHARFLQGMLATLTDGGVKRIVIDCAEATSLCQGVYGNIAEAMEQCRRKGGDLRLAAVNHQILEDLIAHEMVDDLVICSDRQTAVGTFTV